MTREEVAALAFACGDDWHSTWPADQEFLIRFATLVAAKEREQCAQVVDEFGEDWMCDSHELAKIIRARGQK